MNSTLSTYQRGVERAKLKLSVAEKSLALYTYALPFVGERTAELVLEGRIYYHAVADKVLELVKASPTSYEPLTYHQA